ELDRLWQQPEEFLARTFHEPPRINELLLEQFRVVRATAAYHSYLEPADLQPEVFAGVEVPVLLLGGSSDRIIGMDAIRAAAERMPTATLVELARCGHFPGAERPEETVYTIENYLRAQGLS
ncbi:MAG: alpha/beta hydrolase, partial [Myxococcales bacterium]|nr:alpha/beta hydrolase [Myxococcales bacterium]